MNSFSKKHLTLEELTILESEMIKKERIKKPPGDFGPD
jgi:hypothetical protein